jgi:hypothetical protein
MKDFNSMMSHKSANQLMTSQSEKRDQINDEFEMHDHSQSALTNFDLSRFGAN